MTAPSTATLPARRTPTHAPTDTAAGADLTEAQLIALVTRLAADRARWEPLVRHDPTARGWARLPVPEGVDVWVITWPTTHATELHGHGSAIAAFTAVAGTITEIRVGDGELLRRSFVPGQVQTVRRGEIHDVVNEAAEPAVTIHAYSPRLDAMDFYAWADDELIPTRVVSADSDEAAAW